MSCISSVHYQISHAGRIFGHISPTRGLRQGDPLSSYLFLICIEGFTALINNYEHRGLIQGIEVVRHAPPISHMFFADDCYIFCKANTESASHVLSMLRVFELASGQKINADKSSVIYSRNCSPTLKQVVYQILRVKEAEDNSLYLGLPNMINGKKNFYFRLH